MIINEGEATLQLIDMTGRILSRETIIGSVSKAIDVTTGVYILKLNDKVQKIVIRYQNLLSSLPINLFLCHKYAKEHEQDSSINSIAGRRFCRVYAKPRK
jgi:menaquinone-dependent protoporphyrinogen IX oxidase